MEIERKYLIEKEQLPENLSDYPFTESNRDISVLLLLSVSVVKIMNIFSHTNQKASWPEKNIIFH